MQSLKHIVIHPPPIYQDIQRWNLIDEPGKGTNQRWGWLSLRHCGYGFRAVRPDLSNRGGLEISSRFTSWRQALGLLYFKQPRAEGRTLGAIP